MGLLKPQKTNAPLHGFRSQELLRAEIGAFWERWGPQAGCALRLGCFAGVLCFCFVFFFFWILCFFMFNVLGSIVFPCISSHRYSSCSRLSDVFQVFFAVSSTRQCQLLLLKLFHRPFSLECLVFHFFLNRRYPRRPSDSKPTSKIGGAPPGGCKGRWFFWVGENNHLKTFKKKATLKKKAN